MIPVNTGDTVVAHATSKNTKQSVRVQTSRQESEESGLGIESSQKEVVVCCQPVDECRSFGIPEMFLLPLQRDILDLADRLATRSPDK